MQTLTLNNGVEMPALGLGVFQTPPDETRAAVKAALDLGYRHIDTAAAYGNEREVGQAVRDSGVPRDEIFIETKIWISDYGYDATLHGFAKSAAKLGVDQIDLLILHQALPSEFDKTLAAYRSLEKLLADGKVRAIGVKPGDVVVAPFVWADNTCTYCREGLQTSCPHGGQWGVNGVDGGQGQAARVPRPTAPWSSCPSARTPNCCRTC